MTERDVSLNVLVRFEQFLGAAPQSPNLSVVMGPRLAVMVYDAVDRLKATKRRIQE